MSQRPISHKMVSSPKWTMTKRVGQGYRPHVLKLISCGEFIHEEAPDIIIQSNEPSVNDVVDQINSLDTRTSNRFHRLPLSPDHSQDLALYQSLHQRWMDHAIVFRDSDNFLCSAIFRKIVFFRQDDVPNAKIFINYLTGTFTLRACRDILPNEDITIDRDTLNPMPMAHSRRSRAGTDCVHNCSCRMSSESSSSTLETLSNPSTDSLEVQPSETAYIPSRSSSPEEEELAADKSREAERTGLLQRVGALLWG